MGESIESLITALVTREMDVAHLWIVESSRLRSAVLASRNQGLVYKRTAATLA